MPGPVPQIGAGREENRAGSSAGGQGIICADVISAGRGICTNETLCSQPGAGNIFPWDFKVLVQQFHSLQCHRASRTPPGLSLHPKPPPHPVPIFHPCCSKPSPCPCQGWKSPSGWAGWDHSMAQAHTASLCTRPEGSSHHRVSCLGYPKTCPHSLDWDGAGAQGSFYVTHTPRGFPEQTQPWPHTRQGEDSEGRGCPSTLPRPPAPTGLLKIAPHNGGPVWPWWH